MDWSPIRMLFVLSLLIGALLAVVVIVATFQQQLGVVLPVVTVLATTFSGTVGGIILFIKVSPPKDKP